MSTTFHQALNLRVPVKIVMGVVFLAASPLGLLSISQHTALETLQHEIERREGQVRDSLEQMAARHAHDVEALLQREAVLRAESERLRKRADVARAKLDAVVAQVAGHGDAVPSRVASGAPGLEVTVCLAALNSERAYTVSLEKRIALLLRIQGLQSQRVAVAGQITASVERVHVAYRVPAKVHQRTRKRRRALLAVAGLVGAYIVFAVVQN